MTSESPLKLPRRSARQQIKLLKLCSGNIFKWKFNEIFLDEATALIEMMSMMPNSISREEVEYPNCHTIPSAALRQKSCYVNRLRGASPLRQMKIFRPRTIWLTGTRSMSETHGKMPLNISSSTFFQAIAIRLLLCSKFLEFLAGISFFFGNSGNSYSIFLASPFIRRWCLCRERSEPEKIHIIIFHHRAVWFPPRPTRIFFEPITSTYERVVCVVVCFAFCIKHT